MHALYTQIRLKKQYALQSYTHKGIEPFRKCLNYKNQLVCCATYNDLFYQLVHNEFTNAGSMYHLNGFVSLFLKTEFLTRKSNTINPTYERLAHHSLGTPPSLFIVLQRQNKHLGRNLINYQIYRIKHTASCLLKHMQDASRDNRELLVEF